jgi:hypothetical protein
MYKMGLIIIWLCKIQAALSLALGESMESINKLKLQVVAAANYSIAIESTEAGQVKYFINPNQRVFAVRWRENQPQKLSQTLGNYYGEYQAAYPYRRNKFNHRMLNIETKNLVVQQFGVSGQGFTGQAYVKSLQPQQIDIRQILK